MATAGQMIDEVLGLLNSWTSPQEQVTTLSGAITSSATTFNVTSARGIAVGISPGIIEIDSELLYCDTVDGTSCTVTPWGRGYKSTTAASHDAGARIISQPTFPRTKVLDAMNEVIQRVFPSVFAVKLQETTTQANTWTYDLPDDAQRVLTAKWKVPNGRNYWKVVERMRMTPVTAGVLGDCSVDIADMMTPGQSLSILYAAQPTPFSTEADDFVGVTGLHLGMRDVIVYGAASQLVTMQELSRLSLTTQEQQSRDPAVAPAAALTSSRFLEQHYAERLQEESITLKTLYPPRIMGVWL